LQQPTINPNYMMLGWDMQQQIGSGNFIRNLFNTASMSEHTSGKSTLGYITLPTGATDAHLGSLDQLCMKVLLSCYELCTMHMLISALARANFHLVGTGT
jgi:hypothetical protein